TGAYQRNGQSEQQHQNNDRMHSVVWIRREHGIRNATTSRLVCRFPGRFVWVGFHCLFLIVWQSVDELLGRLRWIITRHPLDQLLRLDPSLLPLLPSVRLSLFPPLTPVHPCLAFFPAFCSDLFIRVHP